MKKIGIVIAVVRELKSFLESDFKLEEIKYRDFIIYKTVINSNEVYAIRSGAGLIDASIATQILIDKFDVEIILNYGVTGALDRTVKAKELYVVSKAVNYAFDTSVIDPLKKCQYGDIDDIYIPLDKDLRKLTLSLDKDVREAVCASDDKFVADKLIKDEIKKWTNANLYDMECAGIARTCFKNNVRLLSIKCISDSYDGDGSEFQENIIEAGKKAFDLLRKILFAL